MCGIAGLVGADVLPDAARRVAGMARVLAHRGPDGQGFVSIDPLTRTAAFATDHPPLDTHLILGHRRLSIIDLSDGGRQPMGLEDAPLWITYNGEIYNYVELRRELAGEYSFRTQSDTEVILRAWQKWGPEALGRLNGMFAFALWDGESLYLARDRFGIKPLYLMMRPDLLMFASEIKAFAFGANEPLAIDPQSVAEYFTFQNLFGSRSFFRDVRLLEPAHYCRARVPYDGTIETRGYWAPAWDQAAITEEDAAGRVREKLRHALEIQMRADVEIGAYLSGGLDTSTIVALAARPAMHTFTCGYEMGGVGEDERGFDESALSGRIAAHFGTRHHAETLRPDDLPALIEKTMYHLEEPRVGVSYQNYYICQQIARHVKVVLSGTGGDELFGGYVWRYERVLANREPFDDFYCREWTRLLTDEQKAGFFSDGFASAIAGYRARDSYDAVVSRGMPAEPLSLALAFDFQTFLAGLLIVEDHLSMAHSLESRVPLLENDLVDLTSSLASSLKLRSGMGERNGKWILRRAMTGILPEEVLAAPKQGFIPPQGHWFRTHLAAYLREILESAKRSGYFRPEAIDRYLGEHMRGDANHRGMLWSLLSFELMRRVFVERRP